MQSRAIEGIADEYVKEGHFKHARMSKDKCKKTYVVGDNSEVIFQLGGNDLEILCPGDEFSLTMSASGYATAARFEKTHLAKDHMNRFRSVDFKSIRAMRPRFYVAEEA